MIEAHNEWVTSRLLARGTAESEWIEYLGIGEGSKLPYPWDGGYILERGGGDDYESALQYYEDNYKNYYEGDNAHNIDAFPRLAETFEATTPLHEDCPNCQRGDMYETDEDPYEVGAKSTLFCDKCGFGVSSAAEEVKLPKPGAGSKARIMTESANSPGSHIPRRQGDLICLNCGSLKIRYEDDKGWLCYGDRVIDCSPDTQDIRLTSAFGSNSLTNIENIRKGLKRRKFEAPMDIDGDGTVEPWEIESHEHHENALNALGHTEVHLAEWHSRKLTPREIKAQVINVFENRPQASYLTLTDLTSRLNEGVGVFHQTSTSQISRIIGISRGGLAPFTLLEMEKFTL